MNKRIEELIVQAGNYVNETYTGPVPATFTGNPEWHKEFDKWTRFSEKFAELIVQECAQVSEDDITDGNACCTNTADRIARQIKKHFGVKE
jgi:hypothetical protein